MPRRSWSLIVLTALAVVTGPAVTGEVQPVEFDIVIRNARIVDGTGNPWFRGDVGIRDGTIAGIGSLAAATAHDTIDARERVLAPGFVDIHTHVEGRPGRGGIEQIPRADNFLLDGVTTIVTGNCGSSETRLGEWFARLETLGLGPNLASLVGHNSVRREVMGTANRQARPDEIARMQTIIDRAMRDGAVGFSTGLLYVPGTYADTGEVVQLAQAAARHRGVYASHIRDQGRKLLESIDEAATVGREAGMPVQISHFKVYTRRDWGSSVRSIGLVEELRRDGVDVAVDQYPYDRSSTGLGVTLPSWALADGDDAIRRRLDDPETRTRIVTDMKAILDTGGFPDYAHATVAAFRPDPGLEGKTISEITALKGRPASLDGEIDTILEMMQQGGAQMIYHTMAVEDVERILQYPNTAIASDGGVQQVGAGRPHPRSYGTNARVLAEYVWRRKVLSLEDAIRRMTSLPAGRFGFDDRGLIREGLAADLVLFDPEQVSDRATFQQPHRFSEGFDVVLVNGVVVVRDGTPTEARPGRILRHRAAGS